VLQKEWEKKKRPPKKRGVVSKELGDGSGKNKEREEKKGKVNGGGASEKDDCAKDK